MFCANVLSVSERIHSLNITSTQLCQLINQNSLDFYDYITSDNTSKFVLEVVPVDDRDVRFDMGLMFYVVLCVLVLCNILLTGTTVYLVNGFVPTVDGVEHSNPSVSPAEEINQIPDFAPTPSPKFVEQRPVQLPKLNPRPDLNNNARSSNNNINNNARSSNNNINNDSRANLPSARRFQNFAPKSSVQNVQTSNTDENTRVINGRRAVLRKRVRPATQEFEPTPIPSNINSFNSQIIAEEKVSREESLRERQRQLQQLEDQRAQLRRLQEAQQTGQPIRSESARSFNVRQQQQFKAQPQPVQQQPNFGPIFDPFVTNFNGNSGTYSINY